MRNFDWFYFLDSVTIVKFNYFLYNSPQTIILRAYLWELKT